MISDETMNFKVERDKNNKTKEILKEVYDALSEKGYNPINQIVGYLMSGDPGYITSYKDARAKITSVSPSKILEVIVKEAVEWDPTYITSHKNARNIIRTLERDELLEKMVKNYIEVDE